MRPNRNRVSGHPFFGRRCNAGPILFVVMIPVPIESPVVLDLRFSVISDSLFLAFFTGIDATVPHLRVLVEVF